WCHRRRRFKRERRTRMGAGNRHVRADRRLQDAKACLVNVIPKGETKMKKIVLVVASVVATAAAPTLSQTPPVAGAMKATAPGKGVAANVVEITAVVEA